MTPVDTFRAHIDKCERCRGAKPKDLCSIGQGLLKDMAQPTRVEVQPPPETGVHRGDTRPTVTRKA